MTGIFISTTLFALFASMLLGLGMVWKAFPTTPITDSFVRRCCSPSAAAGQYLAPFCQRQLLASLRRDLIEDPRLHNVF